MADSKHTPGPWHVDPKSPEESFFEDVNILRHDGLAVCVCVHNGDILPPEPLANAHLIAAAPDLLELAFQYRNDLRHPPAPDSRERRLAAIDAVIAKAIA